MQPSKKGERMQKPGSASMLTAVPEVFYFELNGSAAKDKNEGGGWSRAGTRSLYQVYRTM